MANFGDAINYLKECDFKADAWYLDGFAPTKNPDLWTNQIAKEISRLTTDNGTIATYSAASEVNKNFTNAGFNVKKLPGFGKKREMLVGQHKAAKTTSLYSLEEKSWLSGTIKTTSNKNVLVIGAGMTGCTISAALAKRGYKVTIIERNSVLASEASGNPNAILMPRLTVDHDIQSQLTLSGYLHSIRYLAELQIENNQFKWQQCGAIQIPRDEFQKQRMDTIATQEVIPKSLIQQISKQ